ncbi:DNA-directed RNA polymerase III subunit RPC6 [Tetrabaena socialis]|uniref:DNA-directed RNA polymerase III subunit RPC6 n=1 Tax=Tetrabaena socialis TaxID=47790 RepID=A0A2J8A2J4_9CHLO|nr:DNA-directed RNA polymerase III subunit RPC6 [Tetrabaena socialis]|eukprot:PNH06733.1 DNA-directed RNA polymerase III subunit RPC6 [Tetrabaena socialis]
MASRAEKAAEDELLRVFRQHPQGITDDALEAALPQLGMQERVDAVNSLLAANKLQVLEARRLVKSVKNVNNPSRKVYMLAELEPSRELTGGAWYTENQFDSEFINVLREACFSYIVRQGDASLGTIASFIRAKGFSKVELRIEDIQTIVMTLVYDGRVDEVEPEGDDDNEDHYRPAVLCVPDSTPLTDVPCGVCPVVGECQDGGVISPQTCVYYDKWLEF